MHERNWTEVGEKLVRKVGGRKAVEAKIDSLEWQEIPEDGSVTVGMMPGMAINEAISQLGIPKVGRVAIDAFDLPSRSPERDGFYPGFYGIEGTYRNGRAQVFVLDTGSEIVPVVSYFWPTPKAVAA